MSKKKTHRAKLTVAPRKDRAVAEGEEQERQRANAERTARGREEDEDRARTMQASREKAHDNAVKLSETAERGR